MVILSSEEFGRGCGTSTHCLPSPFDLQKCKLPVPRFSFFSPVDATVLYPRWPCSPPQLLIYRLIRVPSRPSFSVTFPKAFISKSHPLEPCWAL